MNMDTLPATSEQAVKRFPYTVEWRYPEPMHGGAVGGSVEINARDQAEAQSKVETMLRKKGTAWETITVVKGRDQGLTMKGGGLERYYHELTALLGIGNFNLYAWSSNEPSPMWAGPRLMPDPDGTARSWWTKFMDESSYGLAVSDFPRFIICDVEGYPTLPLPAEIVRDPKRWDRITTVMRDQLDYWKARLQARIDRLCKVNRSSAEDAEQLKQDKATLKGLEAFDAWSYEAYVEAMLPGRVPHPLDLDNIRLYRLSNGQLIPITDLGRDQLRVDFWRRLLELRDGPGDKWADAVREFLDHHHRHGGKAERFRDLVKVTAQRLRDMVRKGATPRNAERWGLLADKLEGWLELVRQAERLNSYEQRAQRELDALFLNCPKCKEDYHGGLIPEFPCAECAPKLERLMGWWTGGLYDTHVKPVIAEVLKSGTAQERITKLKQIRDGIVGCELDTQLHAGLSKDYATTLPIVQYINVLIAHQTDEPMATVKVIAERTAQSPAPRTIAERLDAVPDARKAFDAMLRIDGFANDAGQYVLKSRKGKGGILANWDAVVERFGIEGYAHDAGLSEALCEYLPGLAVQRRIGKLREGNVYKDGLRSARAYLKG